MALQPKVLALIPARGGSKGVPRKNILQIGGKPMIAWTIEAALASGVCDRVVVSTDDAEIAEVAKKYGAEVPFMRPEEFARDDTPDYPVFQHCMEWLQENEGTQPDIALWLRPTSPLRTADDIKKALELLLSTDADAVRSVCSVEQHPYWMKNMDDENRLTPLIAGHDENTYPRRQLLDPVYLLSGLVEAIRVPNALKNGKLFSGDIRGYLAPPERSREIDSLTDVEWMTKALADAQSKKSA